MNHLTEEDLVLHYYGEAPDTAHLSECGECSRRLLELQQVLNSVRAAPPVPERGVDYGTEVWRRIQPKLGGGNRKKKFQWQVWGSIAAMLVLGITAFWAGRKSAPVPVVAGIDQGAQRRVLVVALSDHLARSQMVLAEITNSPGSDVSYEREQAEDLLDANRLYRQTAIANHDLAAAALLQDLENTLVEIAHTQPGELERLRGLIEERGVVFKVRVYSSGLSAKGDL